jgi:hypothetical protein
MSARTRTYRAYRAAIAAARSDAPLYGRPVYDGNDRPAWDRMWVPFAIVETYWRAYFRTYERLVANRLEALEPAARQRLEHEAERNRQIRTARDPAVYRELLDLRDRVADLEGIEP